MAPAIFVPGQPICFEGQTLQAVYFINRGLVQLFLKTHLAGTLRDYDSFGLDDFVESLNEETFTVRLTARAVGYVTTILHTLHFLSFFGGKQQRQRQQQRASVGLGRVWARPEEPLQPGRPLCRPHPLRARARSG